VLGLKGIVSKFRKQKINKSILMSHCRLFNKFVRENKISNSTSFVCNEDFYKNDGILSVDDAFAKTKPENLAIQ
jgi:hypothetical protein